MSIRSDRSKKQFEQPILDYGSVLTFSRPQTGGTYDTATGLVAGGSPETQTVRGYIGQRNEGNRADAANVQSRRVTFLSRKADDESLDFIPAVLDTVTDGSVEVVLSDVREVRSDGVIIGYSAGGSV